MQAIMYLAGKPAEILSENLVELLRPQRHTDADWVCRLRADMPTVGLLLGGYADRILATTYYAAYLQRPHAHAGAAPQNPEAALALRELVGWQGPVYGNVLLVRYEAAGVSAARRQINRLEAELRVLDEQAQQLVATFLDEPDYRLELTEPFTLDGTTDSEGGLITGLERTLDTGVMVMIDHAFFQPLVSTTLQDLLIILEKLEEGAYALVGAEE